MNNLNRYIEAQSYNYERALKEIKNGKKESHWMWYIFPQIKGLGFSATSKFYEIQSIDEAISYLDNEILGSRLIEISNELLKLKTNNPIEIFGEIDSLKLKSSMTLFAYISDNDIFNQVLEKYYNNELDQNTINICNNLEKVKKLHL